MVGHKRSSQFSFIQDEIVYFLNCISLWLANLKVLYNGNSKVGIGIGLGIGLGEGFYQVEVGNGPGQSGLSFDLIMFAH